MNERPQTAPQATTESNRWQAWRARNEWFAADLYAGALACVLVLGCALVEPSVRSGAQNGLYAVLGAGLAIAALVFAGLAIFVALISEDYLAVLRAGDPRGLSAAWRPYVLVACVALTAAGIALLVSVLWSGLGTAGQAIGLAVPIGLVVWAIVGVGQLVMITRFHGEARAELLGHRISAKALLMARREQRDKSA